LKKIRAELGFTQMQMAAMIGKSYPYFLSIETGQREMSHAVAAEIKRKFGVETIQDKKASPLIRRGGELLPFTRDHYQQFLRRRPSFFLDGEVITPTVSDFAACTHAILAAAEKLGGLAPILVSFLDWMTNSLNDDMYQAFRQALKELYPKHKSRAARVIDRALENKIEDEVWRDEMRREKRNEWARKKRSKNR
jgi:transcriptional regulator with XRE-family HTH domain